jgi:hypothetical protein
VVQHVRAGVEHGLQRRLVSLKSGISTSMRIAGTAARVRRMVSAKIDGLPSAASSRSTEVMTIYSQVQRLDRVRDAGRLVEIERRRASVRHRA